MDTPETAALAQDAQEHVHFNEELKKLVKELLILGELTKKP